MKKVKIVALVTLSSLAIGSCSFNKKKGIERLEEVYEELEEITCSDDVSLHQKRNELVEEATELIKQLAEKAEGLEEEDLLSEVEYYKELIELLELEE